MLPIFSFDRFCLSGVARSTTNPAELLARGPQRWQLDQDLIYIQERLQEIIVLMRVCYGQESQPAVRAEETVGALQRLTWELERAQEVKQATS
jgi:hypothetical protein